MIKCIQNKNVNDFLEMNEEKLLCNESENNLVLGLSNATKEGKRNSEEPLFFTIYENDLIVGQAIRTNQDRPLAITKISDFAITKLVEYLFDKNIKLTGVIGEKKSSLFFADTWSKKCTTRSSLGMHQGIYELVIVDPLDFEGGELVAGTNENKKYIETFILGFIKDCFPKERGSEKKSIEMAERYIRNKTLFLWKNGKGEIVSMAANSRESKNAATVSLVYTPNDLRGRGYGSKVVAALSQKLLDQGKKKCNLFTDLSNPISNSIYQKIGYKMLGESMHFNFEN